jgi:hypothetical protein
MEDPHRGVPGHIATLLLASSQDVERDAAVLLRVGRDALRAPGARAAA